MTEQEYYDNKFAMDRAKIQAELQECQYRTYAILPLLTIKQATEYFNIGENKMREIILNIDNNDLTVKNGNKYLIKRELMEKYLLEQ